MRRSVSSPRIRIPKNKTIMEAQFGARKVGSARKTIHRVKKIKAIK